MSTIGGHVGVRGVSARVIAVDFGGVLTAPERGDRHGDTPVDPAAASAVVALHAAGYRLILASNTRDDGTQRRRPALREAGILGCFAEVILSHERGVAKPDERFFHLVVEAAGVAPAAVVFVDNRLTNVAGAAAAGMQAVLIDRDGSEGTPPRGVPVLGHLAELPAWLATGSAGQTGSEAAR